MEITDVTIKQEGYTLRVADLITSDFYRRIFNEVDKYVFHSYFDNKLYDLIVEPYLSLRNFVVDNKVQSISVRRNTSLQLIAADIAKETGADYKGVTVWTHITIWFSYWVSVLASALYLIWLMLRIPYCPNIKIDKGGTFSVVRSKSGKGRMEKLSIPYEWESPYDKESIYRLYRKGKRIGWVLRSVVKGHKGMMHDRRIIGEMIGRNSGWVVLHSFKTRVVHTYLYRFLIREYISAQSGKVFYTANNRDRFSVIEEESAHDYGKTLVCIPHGLAYGFKFPRGFACDIFYTMSKYAANYLNGLYNTKKFVYSEDIAQKMLKTTKKKSFSDTRLVFFTEPREQYVNKQILDYLLPQLKRLGIVLWMKIHPKEKKEDYLDYNLGFIDNLDDALQNNVCFARKSTTLIEAAYNGSRVAAIIINSKDESVFYTFPSLQSEMISVFNDLSSLLKWINKQFKENE